MRRIAPTPVREALVRPRLWWGCDPTLLTFLGLLCALVGGGGGYAYKNWHLAIVAAVAFVWGRRGLVKLAKEDPLYFRVWWRSLRYQRVYDAVARWNKHVKPRRSVP